jgi:AraC-like DNA-binding protein
MARSRISEAVYVAPASDATAFELAHAGTLQCFSEYVASQGVDPAALAGHAPRASYRAMIELLELAADRLQQPDFGLRLATYQGGGKVFGPIGVAMRNSRTFGDALRYVDRHMHAYSLAATMRIEEDRASSRVFVHFDVLLDQVARKRQIVEQVIMLGHLNAMQITGGRVRARQVRFRHAPGAPLSVYRQHFGCEVLFDQPMNVTVYTHDDLDTPIVAPEAQHFEMAKFFIDSHYPLALAPMHARVRGAIQKHLGVSDCSLERIAEELCVHVRTLHRRLKWEGRSFEDIKDEVRRDLAQYYLQETDIPFTRICEKLGYSETSVLSRSCLRWFGCTPSELRNRAQGSSADAASVGEDC